MKTVIVDIDNTVSDQYSRLKRFYKDGIIHEDAYLHDNIFLDNVIDDSVESINKLGNKYKIVWLSARPKDQFDITFNWLKKYNFKNDGLILVDKRNDKLPILISEKPLVFIDDMKYDYVKMMPKLCNFFIEELKNNNINFFIFENNWKKILEVYL